MNYIAESILICFFGFIIISTIYIGFYQAYNGIKDYFFGDGELRDRKEKAESDIQFKATYTNCHPYSIKIDEDMIYYKCDFFSKLYLVSRKSSEETKLIKSDFIYSIKKLDQIFKNITYNAVNAKLLTDFFMKIHDRDMIVYLFNLGKNINIVYDQNTCLLLVNNFLNALECLNKGELKELAKDLKENKIYILMTLHSILICINILISKKDLFIFNFKLNSKKILRLFEMYTFINTEKFEFITQTFNISQDYLDWLLNAENLFFDFNKSLDHSETVNYIKDMKFKYPIRIQWSIPINYEYLNTLIENNTVIECRLAELITEDEYECFNSFLDLENLDSIMNLIYNIEFKIDMNINDDILKEIVGKFQILPNLKQLEIQEDYDLEYEDSRSNNVYEIFKILEDQRAGFKLEIYETYRDENYSTGDW